MTDVVTRKLTGWVAAFALLASAASAQTDVALTVESRSWIAGSGFDEAAFRRQCADAGLALVPPSSKPDAAAAVRYVEAQGPGFSAFGVGDPIGYGTTITYTMTLVRGSSRSPLLRLAAEARTLEGTAREAFHRAAVDALQAMPAYRLSCSAMAAVLGSVEQQRRLLPWAVLSSEALRILDSSGFRPATLADRAYLAVARRDFSAAEELGADALEPMMLLFVNSRTARDGVGDFSAFTPDNARTLARAAAAIGRAGDDRAADALVVFLNDYRDQQHADPAGPASSAITAALNALAATGPQLAASVLDDWATNAGGAVGQQARRAAAAHKSRLASEDASLTPLLKRAAAYVAQFRRELSGIVAEETYVQDVGRSLGSSIDVLSGSGQALATHRELRSDLLLVRPGGTERPVDFRDVFAVDGKVVRDRHERLTRLFLDRSASATQQLNEIITESARFNIGNIYRNVNTPTLALMFLEPEHQRRFRFTRAKDQAPALATGWGRDGQPASDRFVLPPLLTVIEFQEAQKNTLIRRSTSGGDLPVRGRFWIDPGTGRVLASELIVNDPLVRATINISYQSDGLDGLLPPAEMRERYTNNRDRSTISGTATYGKLRRFQVKVDETIRK